MNYTEKRRVRKIQVLEREIEYYTRVYKHCRKIDILKNRKRLLQKNLLMIK